MINLLHGPDGDGEEAVFLRALQHARLLSLRAPGATRTTSPRTTWGSE